jgi:glycosyltransferase involved in cell wall biosynthesis
MRIGIDARELCGRTTGVGRYLRGLVREWAADPAALQHEFVLYAPEPLAVALDAGRFSTRIVPGTPGTWWEQVRLPRVADGDRLDVFFAPAYTAPLDIGVPSVVAIHDLSFVAHPEWFRIRDGMRRRWLTRQSAAHAQAVVTISQFSRGELIDLLGVPDARIHVIPPGIEPPNSRQFPATGHQPAARVLFVGSIFNRRHVADLIRAFGPIAQAHADAVLDIVGDNRSFPREDLRQMIAADDLQACVHWHEYLADSPLRDLYTQARAFGFLSEYEGLGLTPLEALAAGVPPVLLDTPVARESCGDAALYVPLNDRRATTRALEAVLFDEATRSRLLGAAPAVLAQYDWARAARETLAVLISVR